ncbi:MAG: DUF975 family protein [Lachnospiraceae bacterium]|nr:DUF975 family protein [Lachnospiraceae bacterium]
MFNRAELKARAKVAFRRNYWICIAIGLILSILVEGSLSLNINLNNHSQEDVSKYTTDNGSTIIIPGDGGSMTIFDDDGTIIIPGSEDIFEMDSDNPAINAAGSGASRGISSLFGTFSPIGKYFAILGGAGLFTGLLGLIALAAAIAFSLFICNILEIGGCRFFLHNEYAKAPLADIAYGFDSGHYMNLVTIQFFRTLYVFLWSLLLVIPGIVKSYEYMMVPYLLADNPSMSQEEAFAASKQMMMGNKMDAFVLDLSFIGWLILGAFTFQLANIFWTFPYRYQTKAELYLTLRQQYTGGWQNNM